MHSRSFPSTSISVSEIGFGLWTIATDWWGKKSDDQAVTLLRDAHDRGITFFDAADTYGNGRSERQLARAFAGMRDKVVYATKIGYDIYDSAAVTDRRGQAELPQRFDDEYMRLAVDRCLERLDTDYIDVLQLHNVKMEHVRNPEIWETLRALTREGKIRAWGAAFGPAIGWLYEAVELMDRERDINTIQMIWNILEQHPGTTMLHAAREHAPNCVFNIRVTH
ncbi:MAG: aldo/keto reductase, partial [Gemmatimonadaceae bacterium]